MDHENLISRIEIARRTRRAIPDHRALRESGLVSSAEDDVDSDLAHRLDCECLHARLLRAGAEHLELIASHLRSSPSAIWLRAEEEDAVLHLLIDSFPIHRKSNVR